MQLSLFASILLELSALAVCRPRSSWNKRPLALQSVKRRKLREHARDVVALAKLRELQLKKRVGRPAKRAREVVCKVDYRLLDAYSSENR